MTTQTSPELASAEPRPVPARGLLVIASLVACGWILGLAIMAATTANPVTLNWMQLHQSQVVIVGKVTGKATVSKTESGEWPLIDATDAHVTNLQASGAKLGETYIFPLTPYPRTEQDNESRYAITPTMLPNGAPLIYPFTPDTQAQLRKMIPASPPAEKP